MHRPHFFVALIAFTFLGLPSLFAQKPAEPATKQEKAEGVQHYGSSNISDLQWSETKSKQGNTETITRMYKSVSGDRPFSIEQEKITRINDRTTQVTKTSFNVDAQGNRRPTQVVREERQTSPNGNEQVARTVSNPDLSGQFNVARRETEARTSTAPGQWSTTTAILLPGINGGFSQVQAIDQTEREKAPGVVELNKLVRVPDGNGNWIPSEQHALTIETRKDGSKSEQEQVYCRDAAGQLTLSERDVRSYQKDAAGREYWTTDTYGNAIPDVNRGMPLQLERKVTGVRETLPDGSKRTVERMSDRSSADPSKGLQVVGETVTISKPIGGGVTEVSVEVRAPDVNGGMKTVETRKVRLADK